VGNNPKPVAAMPRTDGASRKYNRPDFVVRAFQIRPDEIERHSGETINVFNNAPSGSACVNNAQHLWPEMAVICRADSLPGITKWLTWWTSGK